MHIKYPSFSSFNSHLTPHTAHLTNQTSQHTTHTSHLTPHTSRLAPYASNQPGNNSNQPGKKNHQPAREKLQPKIPARNSDPRYCQPIIALHQTKHCHGYMPHCFKSHDETCFNGLSSHSAKRTVSTTNDEFENIAQEKPALLASPPPGERQEVAVVPVV